MKKKIIITIIACIFLILNSYVFAIEVSLNTDYTEDYKKYLEASEEEKKKYTVIPNQYKSTDTKKEIKNPILLMNMLGASNESSYSLKDVVPNDIIIKNQKNLTLCWSFATLSALATNLGLKNVSNTYDFSARHMDFATVKDTANGTNTNPYGINRAPGSTATFGVAINYLTNGLGAIKESSMPMNYNTDLIPLNDIIGKQAVTEVYDIKMYPSPTTSEQKNNLMNELKTYIKQYGAVPAQICGSDLNNNEYYNSSTGALYYPSDAEATINHAVAIIGWDDNYAVSNFNSSHLPEEKGAWIVQNSWGTEVGNEGLIYISYYDKNIDKGLIQITNAADKEDSTYTKKYDNNYIYDQQYFGPCIQVPNTDTIYLGNKFTANNTSELVSMVSFVNLDGCECKVYVNTQDDDLDINKYTPVKLKSGEYSISLNPGYHSIEFESPIQLSSTNKNFAVVLEVTNKTQTNECNIFTEQRDSSSTSEFSNVDISNKCFITNTEGFNGNNWTNLGNGFTDISADSTLRAYTLNQAPEPKVIRDISIERGPNKTVYNAGENFDRTGMIVKVLFSDNTSSTVEDYTITNGTTLEQGQTSVTISYNNFYVQQPITVKGTVPDNSIPDNSIPPSNIIPDNTIPPSNIIPDNTIPDVEPTNQPQNSSLKNLKPQIVKITADGIVIKVDNFVQNKNNDSMSYSFYITPYKTENPASLVFYKIDDYQLVGNSLQFTISNKVSDEITNKYNWDNEDSAYLILKEIATLGSSTSTAYSDPYEFDIDDAFSVQIEDEIYENSKYYIEDDTVAKTPIPQTGVKPLFIIALGVGIIGIVLLSRYIILKRIYDGK